MTDEKTLALLSKQGMLPLFYDDDAEVCYAVLKALYAAGIRMAEFTNRGAAAFDNFKYLLQKRDQEMQGMLLAAGTIKNGEDAKKFVRAGADCIISPGMVKEVGTVVQDAGLVWIPGCMTPTEIIMAESAGARLVKIFPGQLLGSGFIRAVKELFPTLQFMPTGGVEAEAENLKAWFDAGVSAVGMGSKLISKEILRTRNYNEITRLANHAMGIISEVRK